MKLVVKPVEPYDFHQCLAASKSASDLPFWEETYRNAFPNFQARIKHHKDGEHQRQGIDATILLDNSKQILVDEKARGRNRNGRIYEDIALEFISNDQRNTPGWVCKQLLCDYIAYAIAPLGICYLLPVLQLQMAWQKNCEKWKKDYFHVKAPNLGYFTHSIAVPVHILFPAIGSCLRVGFTPMEIKVTC